MRILLLSDLHAKLKRHNKHLVLCAPHTQPYFTMERAGFLAEVGAENVCAELEAAVQRARQLIPPKRGTTRSPFVTPPPVTPNA